MILALALWGSAWLAAPATHPHAPAATARWAIDPTASSVQFKVRLFGVIPIAGEFATLEGAIVVDRAREQARVEATVDAGSVRMRNASHAAWARSEEFFDAERHPRIHFESKPVPFAVIAHGGRVNGTLELRGIRRPVSFTVSESTCAFALDQPCVVEVWGSVERSQFGMQSRRATLGDRVGLRFRISARSSP